MLHLYHYICWTEYINTTVRIWVDFRGPPGLLKENFVNSHRHLTLASFFEASTLIALVELIDEHKYIIFPQIIYELVSPPNQIRFLPHSNPGQSPYLGVWHIDQTLIIRPSQLIKQAPQFRPDQNIRLVP
jgi:hypothetical protein